MTLPYERSDAVLVLTVGTGNREAPRSTLFEPLRKSIRESGCNRAVLLPSSNTADVADEFKRVHDTAADVAVARPLPQGAEFDADAAYDHIDSVLGRLLQDIPRRQIEVDFTRGTKAMSAAAVLAATRRAIPNLRYVDGDRDRRGTVRPGTERIRRISTDTVDAHRRRDLARDLMRRGNFSAVADLLPEAAPQSQAIRSAAAFFAAWDRLSYQEASACQVPKDLPDQWEAQWPSPDMRSWVDDLTKDTNRDRHPAMAHKLRLLIVDLLANGERRVAAGQFEDAYVRAYRILELVGQARLFDHGLDSSQLDAEHKAVRSLQKSIKKKRQRPLEQRGKRLTAARFNVSRLLKRLQDPLADRLLKYDDTSAPTWLDPKVRNRSLLIHGFSAQAPADPVRLKKILSDLEDLARMDVQHSKEAVGLFEQRLKIARSVPPFAAP